MGRYLLAWTPMVFIAIANGALRVLTFGKMLPVLRAHQLPTAIGIVALGLYIWAVIRLWPPSSAQQALRIGCVWVLLTIAFEFTFGRVVMGNSWSRLLQDYNLLQGRVWLVVLAWLALAPYALHRLRHAA
jgi:hypothetical protein